jgi:uncharacterized membrane protein YraQ (UPF0718 family)
MNIFYPLEFFAKFITYGLLGVGDASYFGHALEFFIYDSLKIIILITIISFIMAVVRYYLPVERIKDVLTKKRWYGMDYLLAAILGMITPFCSCSSIPLFLGFVGAGIPLGVTFTFLIASPLINEASLFIFPAIFGLKTTLLYNLIGIFISISGGFVIQKLNLEKYINQDLLKFQTNKNIKKNFDSNKVPLRNLLKYFWIDGYSITKSILPYVIIGVGIGALIHGFVPETLVNQYLSIDSWWVVPFATILGVPLYANSMSIIPIMEVLVNKGVPLGSVIAFMTSTITLSIPQALILKKIMKWQLLLLFFGITILGIMIMGYIFNNLD